MCPDGAGQIAQNALRLPSDWRARATKLSALPDHLALFPSVPARTASSSDVSVSAEAAKVPNSCPALSQIFIRSQLQHWTSILHNAFDGGRVDFGLPVLYGTLRVLTGSLREAGYKMVVFIDSLRVYGSADPCGAIIRARLRFRPSWLRFPQSAICNGMAWRWRYARRHGPHTHKPPINIGLARRCGCTAQIPPPGRKEKTFVARLCGTPFLHPFSVICMDGYRSIAGHEIGTFSDAFLTDA